MIVGSGILKQALIGVEVESGVFGGGSGVRVGIPPPICLWILLTISFARASETQLARERGMS